MSPCGSRAVCGACSNDADSGRTTIPSSPIPWRARNRRSPHCTRRPSRGKIAAGPRTGQQVLRFGDRVPIDALPGMAKVSPRCAAVAGLSLHANVAIPAGDRARIERLCRYAARPPLATERLERLDDGRLIYRLRHRWRDGTTHIIFEPTDLVAKLAALVPPPRFHTVRYHGILAPAARHRAAVVPAGRARTTRHDGCTSRPANPEPREGVPAASEQELGELPERRNGDQRDIEHRSNRPGPPSPGGPDGTHPRRYTWPELMRRVFRVDVLECPRCHSTTRILAAIHPPETTLAILECLKLPTRPPPVAPPDRGAAELLAAFDC